MRKELFKILILAVLLIILAYLWYQNFNPKEQTSTPAYIMEESEVMQTKVQMVDRISRSLMSPENQANQYHPYLNSDDQFTLHRDPFVSAAERRQYLAQKQRQKKKSAPTRPVSPSKPSQKSPAAVSQFSLTGIIFDNNNPKAIINNEIYDQGDAIENFQIVQISQQGVRLSRGQALFFLTAPGFEAVPGIILEEETE